ncbi:MAG: L,D-transpeptidase family protein [bacterium]
MNNKIRCHLPWVHCCLLLLSIVFLLSSFTSTHPRRSDIAQIIQELLNNPEQFRTGTHPITVSDVTFQFYRQRNFEPAWCNEDTGSSLVDSLLVYLNGAANDGLNPADYHPSFLDSLKNTIPCRDSIDTRNLHLAALDLFLTDAFFRYAVHLAYGKLKPVSLGLVVELPKIEFDFPGLLESALGSSSLHSTLGELSPKHQWFTDLNSALQRVRRMEKLTASLKFPRTERSKDFQAYLQKRLTIEGDLEETDTNRSPRPQAVLTAALRSFQLRHGLEPTGKTDSTTIAALRIPYSTRIKQIRATMERWRWFPAELGDRCLLVNIPDFSVSLIEDQQVVATRRVALGTPEWPTPLISTTLTHVAINAYWYCPSSIFNRQLFDYVRGDSNYLPRNKMVLLRQRNGTVEVVDRKSIDWKSIRKEELDVVLRQDPGPENIMGQLQIRLNSKLDIYLHDTPYQDDFSKRLRLFSHGCIRVERPAELAEFVLQDPERWNRETIEHLMKNLKSRTIQIEGDFPVHIVYATVWVDAAGKLQFRDDVYGWDRRMDRAGAPRTQVSKHFSRLQSQ